MDLSLIIPAYNVEAFVGPCLDSIYDGNPDLASFEVIVVNDGSTDGTAAVIDRYARQYGNLTVISQENQGLSMARMNGLAKAQGDYVWFVDSDDYLADHAIKDLLPLISTPDAPPVIMTPILRQNNRSGTLWPDYELDAPRLMNGPDILLDKRFPSWSAYRFMIQRSLFQNEWLRFPPGLLHEDEYFGAVLLMIATQVLVYDKDLYKHRIRPGSIMQTISIRSSYDYLSNYALLKAFSKTLPDNLKDRFQRHIQRLLPYSYTVNEKLWKTPEFRRFKWSKCPYLIVETIRSLRLYPPRELASFLFFYLAPAAFRKRFPRK